MEIKYLAHSSFLIISNDNVKIITDPYTPASNLAYEPINEQADIVTVSHGHSDHNNAKVVKGNPVIVKEAGSKSIKGINVKGIPLFHDEAKGSKRGNVLAFCLEIDGLVLCHLGDLGHLLNEQQISALGTLDILFIPVGGYYTIDPIEAYQVARSLKPKIVIPMHFKTDKTTYPIEGVEGFLKDRANVNRINSDKLEISLDKIGNHFQIIVLKNSH